MVHTRLSIIDLSPAGRQPMVSDDNALTLVFNGEIYNYAELRRELETHGYRFVSSTDTEVLLYGLHRYGAAFLSRTNGMFALAAHDAGTGITILARDRLGIKPLYYTERNGRLTFGSEIKAIFALEDMEKQVNLDAVASYLAFRYPILDDTFFEGIHCLPPAHFMEVSKQGVTLNRFWDPAHLYALQDEDKGCEYYCEALRDLMRSSIRFRLAADVPVGSILSGGVDSSVITALVAEERQVHTYTIGYEQKGYNEFDFARMIADRYGTLHHEIRSAPQAYIEHLRAMILFKDAPLSIPNEATQYELMNVLKKDITAVLAGTGADEIFYGYGRIFRSTWDYARMSNTGRLVQEEKHKAFIRNFHTKYGRDGFKSELDHFLHVYQYTPKSQVNTLLSRELDQALLRSWEKLDERVADIMNTIAGGSYLDRMGYAFIKLHLPGILMHNDISSMAASVELRVPFLDHRVVELALSTPVHHKLRWRTPRSESMSAALMSDAISEVHDTPKYVLRKAFEARIPEPILTRRKVGFPVPLHDWFAGPLKAFAKDVLLDPAALNRGFYNVETLTAWLSDESIKENAGDERNYQLGAAGRLWMLLNLELFFRAYFD